MRRQLTILVLLFAWVGGVQAQETEPADETSVDREEMSQMLRERAGDIQQCYEQILATNPDAGGRIVVRFTIGETGETSDVLLIENEIDSGLGVCVQQGVGSWDFAPWSYGVVTVQKAFRLTTDEEVTLEEEEPVTDPHDETISANARSTETLVRGVGVCDDEQLTEAFRSYGTAIRECYVSAVVTDPTLSGQMVVELTIAEGGQVDQVQLIQNDVGSDVGSCVEEQMQSWVFEGCSGGEVTVRKTYVFTPSSGE